MCMHMYIYIHTHTHTCMCVLCVNNIYTYILIFNLGDLFINPILVSLMYQHTVNTFPIPDGKTRVNTRTLLILVLVLSEY